MRLVDIPVRERDKLSKRRVRVWTVRYVVAPEGEDGEVCGVVRGWPCQGHTHGKSM